MCESGSKFVPEAKFDFTDTCLAQKYDLVMASASLHLSENWQDIFKKLAKATGKYLFVTRLPIVTQVPSFVYVQKPYKYGYETEYLCWCINRIELFRLAEEAGMHFVREFLVGEWSNIKNAPEQPNYYGYLFSKELL